MNETNPYSSLLQKLSAVRGKAVVITGGASGIGKSTAQLFAAAGARVAIVDFNREAGESTVSALNRAQVAEKPATPAIFAQADVAKDTECAAALSTVCEQFGHIDVLITSAGIVRPAGSEGNTSAEIRQMLEVNFLGSVHFVQCVVPLMRSGGGRIVCVGSIAGETIVANRDGYCASKAALHAWAMVRAPELRREDIILNVIAPGRVLTELVKGWVSKNENPKSAFRVGCSTQSSGTMLLPEAVAEMIFLLASGVFPVTGTILDLSDGWGRGFQGNAERLPGAFEDFRTYARSELGLDNV